MNAENENQDSTTQTYSIVRFYKEDGKPSEILETGLSLDEVRDHCKKGYSTGDGWFDGWREE